MFEKCSSNSIFSAPTGCSSGSSSSFYIFSVNGVYIIFTSETTRVMIANITQSYNELLSCPRQSFPRTCGTRIVNRVRVCVSCYSFPVRSHVDSERVLLLETKAGDAKD